ncbi:MAG: chromate transporter [Myxococcaceae bacterium]
MADGDRVLKKPNLTEIFGAFLLIGATSFGGGVVAYLRSSLVAKHRWLDDEKFVELLSISQTLPGLVSTNMAQLVGDGLGGPAGALLAMLGICLPGALVMFAAGVLYGHHGSRPAVTAMLHGVAAAAVGLVLATTVQIGQRSLKHRADLGFVALTIGGVHLLHQSVPRVLVAVGALSILWYRPRPEGKGKTQ